MTNFGQTYCANFEEQLQLLASQLETKYSPVA